MQEEEPDVYIVDDADDDEEGQLSIPLPPPDAEMLREYGFETVVRPKAAEAGASTTVTRAVTHNHFRTPIVPMVSLRDTYLNLICHSSCPVN